MGRIEEMDFDRIVPTQIYLDGINIRKFFRDYLKDPKDTIVPVLRKEGKDFLLDGHHSTASHELLYPIWHKTPYIWIAEDPEDFIQNLPENFHQEYWSIENKNNYIWERYLHVESNKFDSNLRAIRRNYHFMRSPENLEAFLQGEGIDFRLN